MRLLPPSPSSSPSLASSIDISTPFDYLYCISTSFTTTRTILFISLLLASISSTSAVGHESPVRVKRAPAVWGAPAPDYRSTVELGDGRQRFMYTLLFVDSKIMEHYENDFLRAKSKILQVVEEANRYFSQLSLSVVVLDILPMMSSDFSLYSFQEFRNKRYPPYHSHGGKRSLPFRSSPFRELHELPEHDFSVLFTYKYAGGLAFVDGLCSPQSVMLCGFFPQEPRAMGGIFFHEVAHLLGVPHRPVNSTLYVPNCDCPAQHRQKRDVENPSRSLSKRSMKGSSSNAVVNDPGCLRIPGFDHDCTAQQFVNYLHKSRCAHTAPIDIMRSSPICGNSVIEDGEDCDCGIPEVCSRLNCIAETCTYRLHPVLLWLFALIVCIALFSLFSFVLHRRGLLTMFTACYKKKRSKSALGNAYASTLLSDDLLGSSPSSNGKRGGERNVYAHAQLLDSSQSSSSSSVVVMLDRPPRVAGRHPHFASTSTATLSRPKAPPPPPPKTRISVQSSNNHGYEIPASRGRMGEVPSSLPVTRRSADPDSISWKFGSFDSDDEFDPVVPVPQETGVPCRPNYHSQAPINRIMVSAIPSESEGTISTDCPSSASSGDVKL